ncbi:aminopeptidase N-like isoform X2 [Onthophagus taurus]|uniref:aminopeptidase N-like isoform X2 n=1 Tax=Onthophagus taurus TaxID=166361 RepID=UPI000C2058F1|nr:aminopeptidase N-like isoform X2 [Onthophagus taurus]
MVGYYSQGVPTAPELENNSNQKKYTVNRHPKGNISISKPACAVFVMAALLLAAIAAVITYFLVPNCDGHSLPESLTKLDEEKLPEETTINYTRLPRSIQPTHYSLFISPELEGNFTTKGNVTITLKIAEKTNTIRLNALDLKIDSKSTKVFASNNETNMKQIKINKQIEDKSDQAYTIYLDEHLNENEEYKLFIKFEGFLNDYMVGFYKSSYIDDKNNTRWLASTQFSPTDARRAFPCFDELDFKAKFQINIGRTADRQTLSNMKIDFFTSEGNKIWDHYKETPLMSTYILAFIVHDFKVQNVNNFAVWSREGHLPETLFAKSIGPNILNFFQSYFNVPYPLEKLDVVALPDFGFSAMENFGLITFRESKLLYSDSTSTTENQRDIALILAHELAHQWFGNLVTPKWWDDLWIKEGFATFFQYLGVKEILPDWNVMDEFYQCQTLEAFNIDKFASSRPIHFQVQNSNDIRQAFDRISYQKGAALIRMLHNFLGEITFNGGLREFIKTYLYSNANNVDLWKILTSEAHRNRVLDEDKSVEEIMKTWMIQAGYPVISVTKNNNRLILNQKRFLINNESEMTSEKWWVPISYETDASRNKIKTIWLKPNESYTINDFRDTWYLLNINQTGYFIVNYDEDNWRKLLEIIMHLQPGIRAQLISDSMDLARGGLLNYDVPLKMISTIGRSDDDINYVHYLAIFEKTNYLHNILRSTPIYGHFEIFFFDTFSFAFESVKFDEYPKEHYLRKRIRSLILKQACRTSDSKCTIEARVRYRNWMNRKSNDLEVIPPNEREIVYCTAIREGGHREWQAAYQAYLQSNSTSDKMILLKSLGCSSQHWILARLLELTISKNSTIRKQDGAEVFRSIATNFHGHSLAFEFLRTKWDEINRYYGVAFRAVSKMVEDLSTFMYTEFQLQQLEQFKKENKYNLKATDQAFDNTIEQVKANIAWMKTNYDSVSNWLKEHLAYLQIDVNK